METSTPPNWSLHMHMHQPIEAYAVTHPGWSLPKTQASWSLQIGTSVIGASAGHHPTLVFQSFLLSISLISFSIQCQDYDFSN